MDLWQLLFIRTFAYTCRLPLAFGFLVVLETESSLESKKVRFGVLQKSVDKLQVCRGRHEFVRVFWWQIQELQ
jgi:hypothetical protein